MFLWKWFTSILQYFGLQNKKARLVLIGLDDAGKTSLMCMLKDSGMRQTFPTIQPTCESLVLDGVTFTAYDLGGHERVRRLWRDYYIAADAIVFLMDASNQERFDEAKHELNMVLDDEVISEVPLLILANKIDKPGFAGEDEIRHFFTLYNLTTGKEIRRRDSIKGRPVELFMCSVLERQGCAEAFRWLANYLD